jgi:hypothetical protein
MRTTVTLDPDVAAKLKRLAGERRISFKEALNSTVRSGLRREEASARPYQVPSRRLGLRPGIDLAQALRLSSELEDAETLRKLALRK